MDDVTSHLVNLSNALDKEGAKEVADLVDNLLISTGSLQKTAQYVGVIGYVLRQNRAMANCIRKKRRDIEGPMQDVVLGCLKEYQTSTHYQDNEWVSKYAQTIEALPLEFDDVLLAFTNSVAEHNDIPEHFDNVWRVASALSDLRRPDPEIDKVIASVRTLHASLESESTTLVKQAKKKIAQQGPEQRVQERWWRRPFRSITNRPLTERGRHQRRTNEFENLAATARLISQSANAAINSLNQYGRLIEGIRSEVSAMAARRRYGPVIQGIVDVLQNLDSYNASSNMANMQRYRNHIGRLTSAEGAQASDLAQRAIDASQQMLQNVGSQMSDDTSGTEGRLDTLLDELYQRDAGIKRLLSAVPNPQIESVRRYISNLKNQRIQLSRDMFNPQLWLSIANQADQIGEAATAEAEASPEQPATPPRGSYMPSPGEEPVGEREREYPTPRRREDSSEGGSLEPADHQARVNSILSSMGALVPQTPPNPPEERPEIARAVLRGLTIGDVNLLSVLSSAMTGTPTEAIINDVLNELQRIASSSTTTEPATEPETAPTDATISSRLDMLVKLANALDPIDREIADLIDSYIYKAKEAKGELPELPEFSVLVKEREAKAQ